MKIKYKKVWTVKIGIFLLFLFLWYWLFFKIKIIAHPDLIKEIYQATINGSGSWPVTDWIHKTLFRLLGTRQKVFWLESLIASLYLGFYWKDWIKKKKLSAWLTLVILLPWFLWEVSRHPIELIFSLYLSSWIIGDKKEKGKGWWIMAVLALGVGKTSLFLSLWSAIKEKRLKPIIIVGVLGLLMLTRQVEVEIKNGSLANLKSEEISQMINLRMGREFTASGENLLPLKIKRAVFNKLVWPGYQVLRRGVSMFDSESWFFPYNMQQDSVWKEGLTEKNIFMAFDWVVLLIIIIGWSRSRRKKTQLLIGNVVVLILAGIVWGKLRIGEMLLLGLPIIMSLCLDGWEKIRERKAFLYLLLVLASLSIFTRGNLLLNYSQIWTDNRAVAYRFIAEEIKNKEEDVLVSNAFGSGEMYVNFFLNKRDRNEKISFGELPQGENWENGIYAGLEGEFEQIINDKNIVAEMKIRDRVTKSLGQKVVIVKYEN